MSRRGVTLVTGGARAGKSHWAEAEARRLGGDGVLYVATARADDQEMARRIARHRRERPAGWSTVEAPVGPHKALADAGDRVVLLDCVTLLVSNLLLDAAGADPEEGGEEEALARVESGIDRLIEALEARAAPTIVVTNEVGLGIVPATPLGRWYRDALGTANRRLASTASRVVLVVSGIPVVIRER